MSGVQITSDAPLSMTHPFIDPVFIDLGFLKIHWYGIMYLLAFLFAYLLAKIQAKKLSDWNIKQVEDLIFYGVLGAVLGGRLGYMFFYNFSMFIDNPIIFFALQNGGMSFHGGFLGVLVASILFSRKYNKTFFATTDFIAPLVPLGLGFGRIGNFINGELWGGVTDSFWGVYVSDLEQTRHPSQLYEAFLEGFVLFIILWFVSKKSLSQATVSAFFLIFYGFFRFIIEFIRVPDIQLGYLAFGWLTMGQLLSIPMIFFGILLLILRHFKNKIVKDNF